MLGDGNLPSKSKVTRDQPSCAHVGVSIIGEVATAVVPDEVDRIQGQIKEWSDGPVPVNLIFTTGGTGFGVRACPWRGVTLLTFFHSAWWEERLCSQRGYSAACALARCGGTAA